MDMVALEDLITPRMQRGMERIVTALNGQPDEVPVMAQLAAHTLRLTGVEDRSFWSDPDVFLRSHLMASEYYRLDTPSTYFDVYNVEAEAMGQSLVWLPGEFPEIDRTRHLIGEPDTLDRIHPPDPSKDGRMPFVIEVYRRLYDIGVKAAFRYCGVFSLAANLRGLDALVMDIIERPEWAHKFFDFLTIDVLAPYLSAAREAISPDMPVLGADALASLPITNPDIVEEFALGYTVKLRELIGNVGLFGWWGDSYAKDPEVIFNLKLTASPIYFYCLDPDAHLIGAEKIKAFADKHNRPLILGMDCPLLADGPIAAIVERARDYVRIGNDGGRLTIFLNAIPSETPPDHVIAAVKAIEFYSRNQSGPGNIDQPFTPPKAEPFADWVARKAWQEMD